MKTETLKLFVFRFKIDMKGERGVKWLIRVKGFLFKSRGRRLHFSLKENGNADWTNELYCVINWHKWYMKMQIAPVSTTLLTHLLTLQPEDDHVLVAFRSTCRKKFVIKSRHRKERKWHRKPKLEAPSRFVVFQVPGWSTLKRET